MSDRVYHGFQFTDESFTFELLRVMTKALEHGSDLGECLAAAPIWPRPGDRMGRGRKRRWRRCAMQSKHRKARALPWTRQGP